MNPPESPEYHDQLIAAFRLSRQNGVGAKRFAQLVREHGDPRAADQALDQPEPPGNKAPLGDAVQRARRFLELGGLGVYFGAIDYPELLAQVPEPPPYLFRRGSLWPLIQPAVAIVGPRDAESAAMAFAFELAGALAARGVTVVSGGARGVDRAAHEGALAGGGVTVLVTATGIDRHYPPEHAGLFDEVAARGVILSELLPGSPPRRDFFPTRNRIVAGLSGALIVVGGKRRSGSASSYRHMRRLGRPIFVWAGARGDAAQLPADAQDAGAIALGEPDADFVCRHL